MLLWFLSLMLMVITVLGDRHLRRRFPTDRILLQQAAPHTDSVPREPPQPLKHGISKTYVINLDSRRDRMNYIAQRLHNLSIPYERFPAVNFHHGHHPMADLVVKDRLHPATKMNLTLAREDLRVNPDARRNWGSTGCWQSHLQVYLDIHNGTGSFLPGPFLILEDDVEMANNLPYYLSLQFLETILPDDWELLFLSTFSLKCHDGVGENHTVYSVSNQESHKNHTEEYVTHGSQLCHIERTYHSSGYLIRNQTTVARMIQLANTAEVNIIDWIWRDPFMRQELTGYAIKRNPVWQRESASNIFMDHLQNDVNPLQLPDINEFGRRVRHYLRNGQGKSRKLPHSDTKGRNHH